MNFMYKIKRFSQLKERIYATLGEARNYIGNHEVTLLGHFICYMGNDVNGRFNDHWPEEITVFIEDETRDFRKYLNKLKHIDMFPKLMTGTESKLTNMITKKLVKEKRPNLIKLAVSSDLLKTLVIEFTNELDQLVKELNRTITSDDSDIELVKEILSSIRSNHYNELSSWRNSY